MKLNAYENMRKQDKLYKLKVKKNKKNFNFENI